MVARHKLDREVVTSTSICSDVSMFMNQPEIPLIINVTSIAAIRPFVHLWVRRPIIPDKFCRICGVVRRRDFSNLPCRGRVKIGLRAGLI